MLDHPRISTRQLAARANPERRFLVSLTVLLALASSPVHRVQAEAAPTPEGRPTVAGEEWIGRAFVPSKARRVGEVRILQRGDTRIVQTLLYTKLLKRVVAEIASREATNWPEGSPAHDQVNLYVQALRRAADQIRGEERLARGPKGRMQLVIEFGCSATSCSVFIGSFEANDVNGDLQVTRRREIASLPLGDEYVCHDMVLIVADAFGITEAEAAQSISIRTGAATGPRNQNPHLNRCTRVLSSTGA